jgi:hypothetical protein
MEKWQNKTWDENGAVPQSLASLVLPVMSL